MRTKERFCHLRTLFTSSTLRGLVFALLLTLLVFAGLSANAASPAYIWIDNVQLYSGQYVASTSLTVTTTKPTSGYAYYENGTLTLSSFSCTAKSSTCISASGDLKIVFSSTSTIRGGDSA